MRLLLAAILFSKVAAAPPGALEKCARDLAAQLGADAPRRLAVAIYAPEAEALAPPVDAVLADALARAGIQVSPLRGPQLADPEGAARGLDVEGLLRVRVVLSD